MTYSDVVKMGLILPAKEKYTKKDFDNLVKYGYVPKVARFICISSAIYHNSEYSNIFNNPSFKIKCGIV